MRKHDFLNQSVRQGKHYALSSEGRPLIRHYPEGLCSHPKKVLLKPKLNEQRWATPVKKSR